MLDVCLLGTGGMMPLPYRYLTSLMARFNGQSILIDCGEGTQVAMKKKGWSPKPIDIILFTHYHADHISGLPGMLLTMGNAERTEPVLMIGPKGLKKVVDSLRIIAPELPFLIDYHEIRENEETFYFNGFEIDAFKVCHNVPCYGYKIRVLRKGKFNVEEAKRLNIPMNCWNALQHGEEVTENGKTYTPDMVMGKERRGIDVVYTTDTRPVDAIRRYAQGADLLVIEGMYGEPDKIGKAKEHKHMMFTEAANIAAKAQPKRMWLTHYSPSMVKPDEYMGPVKEIFENSVAARDGQTIELDYIDED